MDRRDFIKSSCVTCAGGIGLSWLLQACTPHKYITNYSLSHNKVIVKKNEFIVVKNGKTIQQKFIVIKPETLQFPIAIYSTKDNEYKAHLLVCTHQGCEITPYETMMVCPCHGAEFSKTGEVTQGPAETNLKSFITTQDNEHIYIQL